MVITQLLFSEHSVHTCHTQVTHRDDLPSECTIKGVNRYNDILPNPRTRVTLKELDGDIGAAMRAVVVLAVVLWCMMWWRESKNRNSVGVRACASRQAVNPVHLVPDRLISIPVCGRL